MIVAIVAGVGGFWLLLTALVKRDQGWVGISDLDRAKIRIVIAFGLAIDLFVDLLTPAFRKTARAMARLNADLENADLEKADLEEVA